MLQIQQQYENEAEDEIDNALQFKLLSSKVERDIMQEVAFTSQLLNQLHHMTNYISNPNHDPQRPTETNTNNNDNTCYPIETCKYNEKLANQILQKDLPTTSNDDESNIPDYLQHVDYSLDPSTSIDEKIHTFIQNKHLSQDKLIIVNTMFEHFNNVLDGSSKEKEAPILLVTGAPGTGKSWLIDVIDEMARVMDLDPPIKTAFMGIAAINIGGSTINTFLNIPNELSSIPSNRVMHWNADRLE